jgi:hypothetical protein
MVASPEAPQEKPGDGEVQSSWIYRRVDHVRNKCRDRRTKKANETAQDRFARRLANATVCMALFTAAVVVVGILQYGTLDRTDQTLRAAQRPWVSVAPQIAGPLTYTPDEARVVIAFVLKNTGNSPAINVQLDPEIALANQDYIKRMLVICRRDETSPEDSTLNALMGHTIFPHDSFTYVMNIGIRRTEIDAALNELYHNNRKTNDDWFAPEIVGCVSYRFPYQSGRHVTQFVLDLRKNYPPRPNTPLTFKMSDGDVPANDLVLTRSFIGGNAD